MASRTSSMSMCVGLAAGFLIAAAGETAFGQTGAAPRIRGYVGGGMQAPATARTVPLPPRLVPAPRQSGPAPPRIIPVPPRVVAPRPGTVPMLPRISPAPPPTAPVPSVVPPTMAASQPGLRAPYVPYGAGYQPSPVGRTMLMPQSAAGVAFSRAPYQPGYYRVPPLRAGASRVR